MHLFSDGHFDAVPLGQTQGRIRGEKKGSGRGRYQSWVISHAELLRVQREGLLPIST